MILWSLTANKNKFAFVILWTPYIFIQPLIFFFFSRIVLHSMAYISVTKVVTFIVNKKMLSRLWYTIDIEVFFSLAFFQFQ